MGLVGLNAFTNRPYRISVRFEYGLDICFYPIARQASNCRGVCAPHGDHLQGS